MRPEIIALHQLHCEQAEEYFIAIMIWVVFAVVTAAVIAVLLFPVIRNVAAAGDRNAFDRAVFRDQLAELDRDLERGVIAPAEAEAARNEISRRLIAAAAGREAETRAVSPAVALLAVLVVPAVALPLYLHGGQPRLPDVPLAERLENATATGDFEAMIVQVERHLATAPDDLDGWKVLAPAYRRTSRWDDAAEAQRNILRLSPRTADGLADYGEALVLANQGLVTAEAHALMRDALALDTRLPKARFYDALALKQEGKTAEAKASFEAFLAETPADAPWRDMLVAELQGMGAAPPGPTAGDMEAAANLSPEDRQAMIRSMVDGLEERLKTEGRDLDGWLRLIRARGVLGEADEASRAYATARSNFKDDPQALARLEGLAKELNIP